MGVMTSQVKLSKAMSFLLRHSPASAGLTLSPSGWVQVDMLAEALKVTVPEVSAVVEKDSKQRFAVLNGMIRAVQGYSFPLTEELFVATAAPEFLFHGTTAAAWETIRKEGLLPMSRSWVHLSPNISTARVVGLRRTTAPVLLQVQVAELVEPVSETLNHVWLTKHVPAAALTVVQ